VSDVAGIDKDHLRRVRELAGYTPTALADEIGISLKYLCDLESGHRTLKRNPTLIKKIAETLNVPISMIEKREKVAP
jgi:transcriptional regulator with XRE-family HTH domain